MSQLMSQTNQEQKLLIKQELKFHHFFTGNPPVRNDLIQILRSIGGLLKFCNKMKPDQYSFISKTLKQLRKSCTTGDGDDQMRFIRNQITTKQKTMELNDAQNKRLNSFKDDTCHQVFDWIIKQTNPKIITWFIYLIDIVQVIIQNVDQIINQQINQQQKKWIRLLFQDSPYEKKFIEMIRSQIQNRGQKSIIYSIIQEDQQLIQNLYLEKNNLNGQLDQLNQQLQQQVILRDSVLEQQQEQNNLYDQQFEQQYQSEEEDTYERFQENLDFLRDMIIINIRTMKLNKDQISIQFNYMKFFCKNDELKIEQMNKLIQTVEQFKSSQDFQYIKQFNEQKIQDLYIASSQKYDKNDYELRPIYNMMNKLEKLQITIIGEQKQWIDNEEKYLKQIRQIK
ncbi:hypothetical protein pb186bvf_016379 [Paramecium bursaria]